MPDFHRDVPSGSGQGHPKSKTKWMARHGSDMGESQTVTVGSQLGAGSSPIRSQQPRLSSFLIRVIMCDTKCYEVRGSRIPSWNNRPPKRKHALCRYTHIYTYIWTLLDVLLRGMYFVFPRTTDLGPEFTPCSPYLVGTLNTQNRTRTHLTKSGMHGRCIT